MSKNSNKQSVCFMNSNEVWGGGEKWHYETACYLDQAGYSVVVITNRKSDLYNKLKGHETIKVKSMPISNFSFLNPYKLISIRKFLLRNSIHSIFLGLSSDVKLGGLAAKWANVGEIIYRRGSAIPVKNSLLNRYLFGSVLTKIITNSKEIKENVFKKNPDIIDERKVEIIYNGIDFKKWPPLDHFVKDKSEENILTLGNAGRLVEQKGHKYLIKIARHLKDRSIPFKLFIAGSGELENSLKKKCRDEDLTEEIVFLDFVEDMQLFLSGLDIYLSTSLHEGSSHVILEAMGAGKPVIAFNVSSMPELIEDGRTGYLVPFGNTEDFADKIVELTKDSEKLRNLGKKARKHVEEKFDFTKNIQQVLKLIEQ